MKLLILETHYNHPPPPFYKGIFPLPRKVFFKSLHRLLVLDFMYQKKFLSFNEEISDIFVAFCPLKGYRLTQTYSF